MQRLAVQVSAWLVLLSCPGMHGVSCICVGTDAYIGPFAGTFCFLPVGAGVPTARLDLHRTSCKNRVIASR
jgi:hypothetical protein